MICNGQHLNITMGTDVVLRDTLIFDGETFDPALSVGITANLVSSLGKRTALEVEVADGGLIIYVPWQERNAGYYGLEVTGTCNSKKWATYADSLIHYTRATEMGAAEVTIESDYYDITQVVGYRYSTSPIDKVTASVDAEVGKPSVDANYDGKNLSFAFHNIKGETGEQGIQGIQGIPGESAVFDPTTGNIAVIKQGTGDDVNSPMSQAAVTGEFDKFIAEVLPAPVWHNGTVTTNGYASSTTDRYLDELVFGDDISKVIFASQSNESKFYIYGVKNVEGTDVFTLESGPTAITYPGTYTIIPEEGKRYVVRLGKDAVSRNSWTQAAKPSITQYNNSYTHQIDDNTARIDTIEGGLMVVDGKPEYKYGQISSSGYDWTVKTNKVSNEMAFDPSKVDKVRVTLKESGAQYTVYTIVGSTISMADGLAGYTVNDFSFTPVNGTKYVIRFRAVAGDTKELLDALPESAYPCVEVVYASPSIVIEDMESRISALEGNNHSYSRHYSNITGLLNFESKAISAQGIEDSNSALLAKLPNIGCVEVKMNRPTGHFSVWRKTGEAITCLQEDTHYQYRYTGDYSSEYYVMIQAESGETLTTAIASVYTYSDEGVPTGYIPPTWAAGKKVAFLGDSIVQGRYPKNGSSSVNICMDKPWPNLVAEALGTEDYTDFAIGGALVYDNDWKSLSRNASLITGYDVVFVCGGTNDYGDKISKVNFENAYTSMLTTLLANNTKVIAMTPVYRTKTVTSPAMQLSGYAQSVADVAASMEVPVIDTYTLTNTADFTDNLADGLHPNETGQRMIADIVLEEINKL